MPKIWSRRRFRKTPYTYYKSHVPCYRTKPTITSRDIEIIRKRDLKLARHTMFEGKKAVTKHDKSLGGPRDVKGEVKDRNPMGNFDGSSSSTSDQPVDQVSSSTAIILMNDGPACSSLTAGVTCPYCEVLHTFQYDDDDDDDDDVVPELPTKKKDDDNDDCTVPSGNTSSAAAKQKGISQSKACGLNCHNECHKNLTGGISYFIDVDMCEECVANIDRACSQCQLAYRTKKLVGKSNSSSFIG